MKGQGLAVIRSQAPPKLTKSPSGDSWDRRGDKLVNLFFLLFLHFGCGVTLVLMRSGMLVFMMVMRIWQRLSTAIYSNQLSSG
jgi:hypothetical protein